MRLEKLSLYNFKNYAEAQLEFNGNIQCFLGKNGSGKSNLLDAIYYLSFTKSAINSSDQQNIRTGENQFRIKGEFTRKGSHHQVVYWILLRALRGFEDGVYRAAQVNE